jgi:hypothetical protein
LNGFKDWWNSLLTPGVLYVPSAIVTKEVLDGLGTFESFSFENKKLEHQLVGVSVTGTDKAATYKFFFETGVWNRDSFEIPVLDAQVFTVTQDSLIHNVQPGIFERSFSDLSVAAAQQMTLPLKDVLDSVHEEAAKGGEVFEAVGLKIPIRVITLGGNLVVLSIQLYFLVYLRQLCGKLKPDDPAWDVPWIAMDSSVLSKIIFYVSVVILPSLASILLGWQATARLTAEYWERTELWFRPIHFLKGPRQWDHAALLEITFLTLAAIASGYLGLLSWKYRPQVVMPAPSCPSQLFE